MAPATPLCSRARAPFTITFVPGKMRASWPNCNGRFMSRRASSRGRLPCPSVVILDKSVGQDHRARRRPWFRWAQTGQRAQTPSARGHPGDGGGPSGRSRQCVGPTRGGAAACRLPEHPDGDGRCRLREPQVGARAKTASRVATAHHQTPAARLQGSGPDLDRGAHVCVAGQKSSLEQRLRVEGSKLRKPSSTWRPSASCSNGSPRGKTSQTPSEPIASPFAPRFRCKMTLHLIPEPEEKASELLRDLIANDNGFEELNWVAPYDRLLPLG